MPVKPNKNNKKEQKVTIIAGPCSVDENNLKEIKEIADIMVTDAEKLKKAVWGTRVVGLKSRTGWDPSGAGMGMDHDAVIRALHGEELEIWPSMLIAKQIHDETGLAIASEIVLNAKQMAVFEKAGIPYGKLLAWNPAPNQLGWPIMETAAVAKRNGWLVGIKNSKWIGDVHAQIEDPDYDKESSLEKQWLGAVDYASTADSIILIHRGVDVPNKGDFRNALIHETSRRVKNAAQKKYPEKDIRLFFDPSHSYGPKLRDQIPAAIIEAMRMSEGDEYLYDGVLVETGTSQTDTEQHITVAELREVVNEIAKFRLLMGRD